MKKLYYVIPLLMGGLIALSTIGITDVSAAGLQVTFTTNPEIVAPGTDGYIEVNLKSLGTPVTSIQITASSWDPTVIIAQGNWVVDVGSLDSGAAYSAIYEFKVSSIANPGLYQVVFEVTGGGVPVRQTAVIQVVDTTVLDIESVSPSSITIGEATTLTFTIANNGGADLKNVLFTWADPNNLILPVGTDNRITIPDILAKNSTALPITVMASSGISPGIYPLTITMTYYDLTGTAQTIVSTVGMQISGTTTFDIVVQQTSSGSTTLSVVNTGANIASSVIVSIPQQQGYQAVGTSQASLGNLDAGDYTLATFQITSLSGNSTSLFPGFNRSGAGAAQWRNLSGGNGRPTLFNQSFAGNGGNSLLVQISYTDVFGIRQTVQKQVSMSSSSSIYYRSSSSSTSGSSNSFQRFSQSQSSSSDSNNSLLYIGIGVVGIVVIISIIQIGRKKKLPKLFKGRKE